VGWWAVTSQWWSLCAKGPPRPSVLPYIYCKFKYCACVFNPQNTLSEDGDGRAHWLLLSLCKAWGSISSVCTHTHTHTQYLKCVWFRIRLKEWGRLHVRERHWACRLTFQTCMTLGMPATRGCPRPMLESGKGNLLQRCALWSRQLSRDEAPRQNIMIILGKVRFREGAGKLDFLTFSSWFFFFPVFCPNV
jgi:hypothetical protein